MRVRLRKLASLTSLGAARLVRGSRTSLPIVIISILLLFIVVAGIFAALNLGLFDKMLLRFSSDKGSASARFATFNLLSYFDWNELLLGPSSERANALQAQLGLAYGIENFWASCIVQFGGVPTALLSIGLVCLFIEIFKRSSAAMLAQPVRQFIRRVFDIFVWREVGPFPFFFKSLQGDSREQAFERRGKNLMLPLRAEHDDGRRVHVATDRIPGADDGAFRQTHEQREIVAQRTAVDYRGCFGKASDQIEAADAAPRTAFEPRREIKQQG